MTRQNADRFDSRMRIQRLQVQWYTHWLSSDHPQSMGQIVRRLSRMAPKKRGMTLRERKTLYCCFQIFFNHSAQVLQNIFPEFCVGRFWLFEIPNWEATSYMSIYSHYLPANSHILFPLFTPMGQHAHSR